MCVCLFIVEDYRIDFFVNAKSVNFSLNLFMILGNTCLPLNLGEKACFLLPRKSIQNQIFVGKGTI